MPFIPIAESYDTKPKSHTPFLYVIVFVLVVGVLGSFVYTTQQIERVQLPQVSGVAPSDLTAINQKLDLLAKKYAELNQVIEGTLARKVKVGEQEALLWNVISADLVQRGILTNETPSVSPTP